MTSIKLPPSVPFPVTITAIVCHQGQTVSKHETIVKYKYWDFQDDPQSKEEEPPKIRVERIGTFESPVEGVVENVYVHVHDEVYHSEMDILSIKEECTHTVQYGGLCALCGRAIGDDKDYTGYDYQERATISMSYDNTGLKISLDEAKRIEEKTTLRLAKEKKLILVVDLDQTVIHATVDPTVGEWQSDPQNPNYGSVKDVKSFCLEEEIVQRGQPSKCWYYVKVRPGLDEFLEKVSQKYELHIYTMATRNYALAIAKIIDPSGCFFGDRILSRDESGSLTHKNLKRLFPVDQSMVVIIDDRGDVWQWESNLIKVVPYDFFVGIGDINSSFLPKKNGQLTGPSRRKAKPEPDLSERLVEMSGDIQEQAISRSASIEQQQHDRPLAKLQHELSEDEDEDDNNLLHDDDTELYSLESVLSKIHTEYYTIKEQQKAKPDLTRIIPHMKSSILRGITILFSGIIPLGINFDNADLVIWCRQFGVTVVKEVFPSVTHVVCRNPSQGFGPTFKARVARKLIPDVKIVNPDWLFACLSKWERADESQYLVSYIEEDWKVNEDDVEKYQAALQAQESAPAADTSDEANIEYEYDEANQEVDDFLADISDDEEEESLKRKLDDVSDDDAKRAKNGKGDDMDELEQELLDVFDDLEDE